jgi:hypothetical protein
MTTEPLVLVLRFSYRHVLVGFLGVHFNCFLSGANGALVYHIHPAFLR